jgi:hypothetical protein
MNNIRGICSTRKLLASATGGWVQAESFCPRLGGAAFSTGTLLAAVDHLRHLASRPL